MTTDGRMDWRHATIFFAQVETKTPNFVLVSIALLLALGIWFMETDSPLGFQTCLFDELLGSHT